MCRLPGKAYAKRQHVWLTGANEVDSKVFSRAILAKLAITKTWKKLPSLTIPPRFGYSYLGENSSRKNFAINLVRPSESDSEVGTEAQNPLALPQGVAVAHRAAAEPSELMQLEMSEDIRLGPPDDGSNNLDLEFQLLAASQAGNPADHHRRADSYRAESIRRWLVLQDPLSSSLQAAPPSGGPALEELNQEDTHYSQTVSTILQRQSSRWSESSSSATGYLMYSSESAFSKWMLRPSDHHHHHHVAAVDGTSQWLLKYILLSVPFLHIKYRDENSPKSRDAADSASRFRKRNAAGRALRQPRPRRAPPQDELFALAYTISPKANTIN
ncbi:Basic helix-loop-helix protein A [Camellia lanceoleosa]|uniref:Basic helix-loop-helix protein A n=1 Tax=Camellia lanceoleosa TaxID=1840588 RepID=A0ACC0F4D0_9ERIC|nr:Basic helix-loop-helix protein A [Camellia lanceoleosa]